MPQNSDVFRAYSSGNGRKSNVFISEIFNYSPRFSSRIACSSENYDILDFYLPYGYVKPTIYSCENVILRGTGKQQNLSWLPSGLDEHWDRAPARSATLDLADSGGIASLTVGEFPSVLSLKNVTMSTQLLLAGATAPLHVSVRPEANAGAFSLFPSKDNAMVVINDAADVRIVAGFASSLEIDSRGLKFLLISGGAPLELKLAAGAMESVNSISAAQASGKLKLVAEQTGPLTILGSRGHNDISLTGSGDVSLVTREALDVIRLGAGNDVVDAGEGNDWIAAGAGRNIITMGVGRDRVIIEKPDDSVLPSRQPDMMTTITDFDPDAGDILRFAFLPQGQLIFGKERKALEPCEVLAPDEAMAKLRSSMEADSVASLRCGTMTYVIVNNADETTVRLHGNIDLQPKDIFFG